jgi:hypothetical protein
MRYRPTVDIWSRPSAVHTMQRGQWVSAGPIQANRMNTGRFCGVTKSNSIVVAWHGNARKSNNYNEYIKTNMNYAISKQA